MKIINRINKVKMKRKLSLMWVMLLACLTIDLSSCSKSDEPSTSDNVVGTWKCIDNPGLLPEDKMYLQLDDDNKATRVIFHKDGTNEVMKGEWVKNGLQLTLKNKHGFVSPMTIVELTSTRMTVNLLITVVFERMNDPQFAQQLRDMEETEFGKD